MKAICITHENFAPHLPLVNGPIPEIGEVVTVIGEKVFPSGRDCYLLAEYQHPDPFREYGYDKRNFSPLTGIDETTLVNEEWEEKYCVPVNHEPCV